MIRRLVGAALAACTLFALPTANAWAEAPPGPRLTFMEADDSALQLVSVDPLGGDRRVIVGGDAAKGQLIPSPFSPPAWSADGTRVAFTGLSHSRDELLSYIYQAAADGSDVVRIPSTKNGLDPVLSPDGHALAFVRERERESQRSRRGTVTTFRSVSVWLLDLDSAALRQLTPWQNGLYSFPSGFSPDGSTLAITRNQRLRHNKARVSAVAIRLDGSGSTLLAKNAGEPVYSPNGTSLALITVGKPRTFKSRQGEATILPTELAVANADGSGLSKLTHTRGQELLPSWDPSGQRLAYTQFQFGGSEAAVLGFGDSIMEINANGTCRTKILSLPKVILYGATWQPGPCREAGPISC